MNQLLSLFPKGVLAFLVIGGGILFLVLVQPPHTICDSQIEVLNNNQRKFLFKDSKSKLVKTSRYSRLREQCFNANNPGGCYELFREVKVLVLEIRNLSEQCAKMVGDEMEYKRAMWDSVDLLVRLAWGRMPPASVGVKYGWLEVSDLTLYCRLKERIVDIYGQSEWDSFREKKMRDLPGAKDLARNQQWELSLFSENCARYP